MRFLRYHATVERRIRELGIGFTFLRPNLYFQGLQTISHGHITDAYRLDICFPGVAGFVIERLYLGARQQG